MKATYDVWTDPDLRELVRNEPELAVIADALAQAEAPTVDDVGRRRLLRSSRVVAVAAAITAGVVVALVAPWDRGNGDLSGEALAAVGPQPVLHVVVDLPVTGQLVNLQTGTAQPVVQQEEIWYDAGQGLERDVVRLGGAITDDTLQTPQGGYTPGGIVYDCAWIAAHPVAATKAGVSCNASGDNGTVPHVVPRPKPTLTLEPGLAGFVDGYQQALASGQATDGGSGELDGQSVDWLIFQTSSGEEKVALDQTTHKPVLLENNNGPSLTIDSIGTVPYDATDFARPAADEVPAQPSYFRAGDGPAVALDGAAIAAAMPGAVWAGPSLAGLPLTEAEQQPLTATFANNAEPPQTGTGIQLEYGQPDGQGFFTAPSSQPRVQINEAPSPTLGFPNMWSFVHDSHPSPDTLYEPSSSPFRTIQVGYLVSNGVYVTIWASSSDLLLQTARGALEPAAR